MEVLIEKYNKLVSSDDMIKQVEDGFIWRGRKWLLSDYDIMEAIIVSLIQEKEKN